MISVLRRLSFGETHLNTILIGYDLKRPGQNYTNLINALKAYSTWWHGLDSTWMVRTTSTAGQVRDVLLHHIDQNDRLFVVDITGKAAAWYGFDKTANDWLLQSL